jgi:hypothetical protein
MNQLTTIMPGMPTDLTLLHLRDGGGAAASDCLNLLPAGRRLNAEADPPLVDSLRLSLHAERRREACACAP